VINPLDPSSPRAPAAGARASALAGDLTYSDPLAEAAFDPYNTGSFRVMAEKPRRRTLDDMRRLDAEIRRKRKPWA
jgi:hypothetical protein